MHLRKVLVLGVSGQVGRSICAKFRPFFEIVRADRSPEDEHTRSCDLANLQSLEDLVLIERPDIIINCAAYTAVDLAEKEFDLAMKINGIAVERLAKMAASINAILIHYSTDYVFDGSGTRSWTELDIACPINAYGRSKLYGDEAIVKHCPQGGYIFRTQWVYDNEGKNFLNTLLKLGGEREDLSVVGDQIGAPTTSYVIADLTFKALEKILSNGMEPGIYNLVCSGEVSWHGFAAEIFRQMKEKGHNLKVQRLKCIESKDYPTPAPRPKNSRLNTTKIERVLGQKPPTWEESLSAALKSRK